MSLFYCEKCGIVWAADDAPVCRHYAVDLPAAEMVPLPDWHPFADEVPA